MNELAFPQVEKVKEIELPHNQVPLPDTSEIDEDPGYYHSLSQAKRQQEAIAKIATLNTQELQSQLQDALYREESPYGKYYEKEILILIIEKLWSNSDITFFEKFSIIQKLQSVVTCSDPSEGDTSYEEGCLAALKVIDEHEKNFFLQSVVSLFNTETYHEYSLEERREMIQKNWKDLSPSFADGVTHLEANYKDYAIPGEARSAADLPENIVLEITHWWIREDQEWLTAHAEKDRSQRERLVDPSLQSVLPSHLIIETSAQRTPHQDCYRLANRMERLFSSSVSTEYGALYNGSGIESLYHKVAARKSSITIEDLKSISYFLIGLKQARPDTAFVALSVFDSHRAKVPDIPLVLQRNASLLVKMQRYADELLRHRDAFQYDAERLSVLRLPGSTAEPEHERDLEALHRQGYEVATLEDGSNAFDALYTEILSWLQGELEESCTPSLSIDDVIHTALPDITKEEALHLSTLYNGFSSARMRIFLEDYFGFSFGDIPFRAQLQFINYVHDKNAEDIQAVQSFIQRAGSPEAKAHRFVVFLALEKDITPETFYRLDTALSPAVADQVFAKYAELTATANSVDTFLHDILPKNRVAEGASRIIIAKLQRKGVDFLIELATAEQQDEAVLLDRIAGFQANLELFKTTFKTLKENGVDINLKELKDLDWQIAVAPEYISRTDREEMKRIYESNYPSPQYTDEFRTILLQGLDARLQNPACRFYLLKHKNGNIIGFNAYHDTESDTDGHEHTYFGAFNINPQYGQNKLGEAILDATLASEGEDKIIDAHCDVRSPISAKYIESGFIATGFETIAGSPSFSIVRNPARNQRLLTKRTNSTLTPEVLDTLATAGSPREDIRVIRFTAKDAFPEQSFREGFVITHYRFLKDGSRLVVFERPQTAKAVSREREEMIVA